MILIWELNPKAVSPRWWMVDLTLDRHTTGWWASDPGHTEQGGGPLTLDTHRTGWWPSDPGHTQNSKGWGSKYPLIRGQLSLQLCTSSW